MGLPFYSKRTAQCSRYHFDISAYHFDIAARDMASNCAEIAAKERRDRLEKTKATASAHLDAFHVKSSRHLSLFARKAVSKIVSCSAITKRGPSMLLDEFWKRFKMRSYPYVLKASIQKILLKTPQEKHCRWRNSSTPLRSIRVIEAFEIPAISERNVVFLCYRHNCNRDVYNNCIP